MSVAVEGELPRSWKQSFETTVRLLGDGEWAEVRIKKQTVEVSDVPAGNEEKLSHHLESVVDPSGSTLPLQRQSGSRWSSRAQSWLPAHAAPPPKRAELHLVDHRLSLSPHARGNPPSERVCLEFKPRAP